MGFGNEDNPHNYHFTFEIHAEFTYEGGEVFTFTGDDDLFTFINDKLAIDLGGVHGPQSDTIDLDQRRRSSSASWSAAPTRSTSSSPSATR